MPSSLAWPTRSRNGDWNVVTQAPIGIAVPIGVYEYRPRMSSLRGNTYQRAYHFAKANAHTLGCLREICDGLGACIMTTPWRKFEKPNRTADNRIEGAVLALPDNDRLKHTEDYLNHLVCQWKRPFFFPCTTRPTRHVLLLNLSKHGHWRLCH